MGIDPVSLALIGTVVAGAGAVQQMVATRNMASYEQKLAERNQLIQEDNARSAVLESQIEQQDWSRSAREQIGQMVAEMGASGLSVNSGSNLLRRVGTQEAVERDAQRIREDGNNRADQFRQRASDSGAEASLAGARKRNATTAGIINIGSTLIGGATQVNRAKGLIE